MGMLSRRDWRDELQDDVLHHLTRLRREVIALSGDAGRTLQHGAHDLGEVLVHEGAALARQLGRQAKRAGKAVRRDPVPAVVAVIGLACLTILVLSRRS